MNGYFIHLAVASADSGVATKIDAQVTALSAIADVERIAVHRTSVQKAMERLPLYGCRLQGVLESLVHPDFLYVRKWTIDHSVIGLLRDVKRLHPGCKIVIEIPAYPYDREYLNHLKNVPLLVKDWWHRRHLHEYADRIATYSDDDLVFGIQTLRMVNGIEVASIRRRSPARKERGRVDLVAVATMLRHHGYDRVLLGMQEYYRSGTTSDRVVLHLVGCGPELAGYRAIADSAGISENVVFHGQQAGESLDTLFDYCDIGLVTFGAYRNGLKRGSFLKSREYLSRGIPMVTGCPIDIFEGIDYPYCLEVPNDNTPVSISDILAFHRQVTERASPDSVAQSMREFAFASCDMRGAMNPVIQYLLQPCERWKSERQ